MATVYFVQGGEVDDLSKYPDFPSDARLGTYQFEGAYLDRQMAYDAWKARAFATVDNAHMRFTITERPE